MSTTIYTYKPYGIHNHILRNRVVLNVEWFLQFLNVTFFHVANRAAYCQPYLFLYMSRACTTFIHMWIMTKRNDFVAFHFSFRISYVYRLVSAYTMNAFTSTLDRELLLLFVTSCAEKFSIYLYWHLPLATNWCRICDGFLCSCFLNLMIDSFCWFFVSIDCGYRKRQNGISVETIDWFAWRKEFKKIKWAKISQIYLKIPKEEQIMLSSVLRVKLRTV